MDNSGIRPQALEDIKSLAQQYGLTRVILFGSRARGDYQRASDIDLAVSGGDIVRFAVDVEEKAETLLRFDVVNLDRPVQEKLLEAIRREGKVIYEKV